MVGNPPLHIGASHYIYFLSIFICVCHVCLSSVIVCGVCACSMQIVSAMSDIITPRRACAARVTVVVLCVCQCVQASHPLLTQLQDQVDIPMDSISCSLQN